MPISYEVYVRHEIYENLEPLPESDRNRIFRFLESLSGDPFQEGEVTGRDSGGRECQVKLLGRFAVYYWPDHAEKEVRVVDLVDADRV